MAEDQVITNGSGKVIRYVHAFPEDKSHGAVVNTWHTRRPLGNTDLIEDVTVVEYQDGSATITRNHTYEQSGLCIQRHEEMCETQQRAQAKKPVRMPRNPDLERRLAARKDDDGTA